MLCRRTFFQPKQTVAQSKAYSRCIAEHILIGEHNPASQSSQRIPRLCLYSGRLAKEFKCCSSRQSQISHECGLYVLAAAGDLACCDGWPSEACLQCLNSLCRFAWLSDAAQGQVCLHILPQGAVCAGVHLSA